MQSFSTDKRLTDRLIIKNLNDKSKIKCNFLVQQQNKNLLDNNEKSNFATQKNKNSGFKASNQNSNYDLNTQSHCKDMNLLFNREKRTKAQQKFYENEVFTSIESAQSAFHQVKNLLPQQMTYEWDKNILELEITKKSEQKLINSKTVVYNLRQNTKNQLLKCNQTFKRKATENINSESRDSAKIFISDKFENKAENCLHPTNSINNDSLLIDNVTEDVEDNRISSKNEEISSIYKNGNYNCKYEPNIFLIRDTINFAKLTHMHIALTEWNNMKFICLDALIKNYHINESNDPLTFDEFNQMVNKMTDNDNLFVCNLYNLISHLSFYKNKNKTRMRSTNEVFYLYFYVINPVREINKAFKFTMEEKFLGQIDLFFDIDICLNMIIHKEMNLISLFEKFSVIFNYTAGTCFYKFRNNVNKKIYNFCTEYQKNNFHHKYTAKTLIKKISIFEIEIINKKNIFLQNINSIKIDKNFNRKNFENSILEMIIHKLFYNSEDSENIFSNASIGLKKISEIVITGRIFIMRKILLYIKNTLFDLLSAHKEGCKKKLDIEITKLLYNETLQVDITKMAACIYRNSENYFKILFFYNFVLDYFIFLTKL